MLCRRLSFLLEIHFFFFFAESDLFGIHAGINGITQMHQKMPKKQLFLELNTATQNLPPNQKYHNHPLPPAHHPPAPAPLPTAVVPSHL